MIEDVDSRLAAWAERAAGPGVQVSLRAPADSNDGVGVSVFLIELAAQPPLRGERSAPLQLALRYLVTAWAGEPAAEHAVLGRLVFEAMEEEDSRSSWRPSPRRRGRRSARRREPPSCSRYRCSGRSGAGCAVR
jgi:hypothetical protein